MLSISRFPLLQRRKQIEMKLQFCWSHAQRLMNFMNGRNYFGPIASSQLWPQFGVVRKYCGFVEREYETNCRLFVSQFGQSVKAMFESMFELIPPKAQFTNLIRETSARFAVFPMWVWCARKEVEFGVRVLPVRRRNRWIRPKLSGFVIIFEKQKPKYPLVMNFARYIA